MRASIRLLFLGRWVATLLTLRFAENTGQTTESPGVGLVGTKEPGKQEFRGLFPLSLSLTQSVSGTAQTKTRPLSCVLSRHKLSGGAQACLSLGDLRKD